MRAFCLADGRGARLSASAWPSVAPLVGWALEPAWDHINLIHGYEMGTPRTRDGVVEVEVRYSVVGTVDSRGSESASRVESQTFTLEPDGAGGWRLRPPAPPPYVFDSEADGATLAALLAPQDSPYLSNSAFVWQLLRNAGWETPYTPTGALAQAPGFSAPPTANVGDLVLYYRAGTPYHVGMVESPDTVVSATLNGGIRRTAFDAFAGDIRYLRPLAGTPAPAATPPTAVATAVASP